MGIKQKNEEKNLYGTRDPSPFMENSIRNCNFIFLNTLLIWTFYQINRRCPDKCKFVKNPMNIIDLLAVLPWVNISIFLLILYCSLITTVPPGSGIMWALLWCEPALERANSPRCWKSQLVKKQSIMNYAQVRRIAQFFRIMRIVRIFKVKMFVLRISSLEKN